MFRSIEEQDLIAGRLDFLPIGFGTVTSVGGVGHYRVFNKLRAFQKEIAVLGAAYSDRVESLYQYWLDPWTARRSNQSILKEIHPGCSLEGLILKLKLQYFGHLM